MRKHETNLTLQPGETVLFASLPETENVQPFKSPAKTKRLIATISARLVRAPAKTAAAPVLEADGYTIDLSLAPQVVEFEGIIDYSGRLQTTSTNALGHTSESVFDEQPQRLGGLVREEVQQVERSPRGIIRAEPSSFDQEQGESGSQGSRRSSR